MDRKEYDTLSADGEVSRKKKWAIRSDGSIEDYMDQTEQEIAAESGDEGQEHLAKTESSNIAAETSHGKDPGERSYAHIDGKNSKGVEEHLTKTESSNIAAETSHGEDPGDISLSEIDKHNRTKTEVEPGVILIFLLVLIIPLGK